VEQTAEMTNSSQQEKKEVNGVGKNECVNGEERSEREK